jgi:hypothetical protein
MYNGDTFFHLSQSGQTGLLLLSGLLGVLMIWVLRRISSRFGKLVNLLSAIVLIWMFIWLSPQIYYTYYWLIFDDLPVQWVIAWPPAPSTLIKMITFTGNANLSDHSKGILFWMMVVIAVFTKQKQTA